jgi:hypothetical protein
MDSQIRIITIQILGYMKEDISDDIRIPVAELGLGILSDDYIATCYCHMLLPYETYVLARDESFIFKNTEDENGVITLIKEVWPKLSDTSKNKIITRLIIILKILKKKL